MLGVPVHCFSNTCVPMVVGEYACTRRAAWPATQSRQLCVICVTVLCVLCRVLQAFPDGQFVLKRGLDVMARYNGIVSAHTSPPSTALSSPARGDASVSTQCGGWMQLPCTTPLGASGRSSSRGSDCTSVTACSPGHHTPLSSQCARGWCDSFGATDSVTISVVGVVRTGSSDDDDSGDGVDNDHTPRGARSLAAVRRVRRSLSAAALRR